MQNLICLRHNYCSTATCLCLKKPKKELTYTLDGLINRGRGGGGGGLISGINIAKMDELISGGGLKPGGFNVGFYGSIFFYCFDSAMILNDGKKMVLVWIWDEGEGVAARPGTEFK